MINRSGIFWLGYLLTGFCITWLTLNNSLLPTFRLNAATTDIPHQSPIIRDEFISGGLTNEVHSATAVEMPDGDIGVFWYAGTQEGSMDVAIFSRFLEQRKGSEKQHSWSEIRQVIDRAGSVDGLHRHIRKLGNPLALYYHDKLWLFYVTVSVGGWAGSSINLIQSSDKGRSWSSPERLITSPFINISTLVKERAIISEDGILLPVYHEFMGKFSEILRLDPQGEVIDKYRISHGRGTIQPVVLPQNETNAIVLLRNAYENGPHNILASQTFDGGESWESLSALALPNPNAAISSVSLDRPNELLLVFNNDEKERSDLTLAYAADFQIEHPNQAGQWQLIYEFENQSLEDTSQHGLHNPYSYPFLLKTREGNFHLFYTWKRKYIKHVFFNRAELDRLINKKVHSHLHKEQS